MLEEMFTAYSNSLGANDYEQLIFYLNGITERKKYFNITE